MKRERTEFGMRISECGIAATRRVAGHQPFVERRLIRNPQSAIRNGLTLIELLVVIVILTTLVGGVLPVLSPNNDARRIREAARGLQTFIMQAQSRAARTGRPAGISFRESSPGSGVALEAYQIEVPPPFAGFSQYSASRVRKTLNNPSAPLRIQFVLTDSLDPTFFDSPREDLLEYAAIEELPPKFIKPGDIVVVSGVAYRLLEPPGMDLTDDEGFFDPDKIRDLGDPQLLIPCELVDDRQTLAIVEEYNELSAHYGITSPKGYRILRQPRAVATTAEAPYQLPAGVCIDLQASGTEGGATPTQFASPATNNIKQIALLCTPAGGIESIHYTEITTDLEGVRFPRAYYGIVPGLTGQYVKRPITDASKVFLLLGRVENGGVNLTEPGAFMVSPQGQTGSLKERIAELQNRINWLNLDSRWIAIDTGNGRTVVSGNAFVDPSSSIYRENQKADWLVCSEVRDARQLARNMQRGGER